MTTNKYDQFMNLIMKSNTIVALTGAGISTSAKIPDFRSPKGIYVDPTIDGERVFDINIFKDDPTIFGRFFAKLAPSIDNAKPTKGHIMLKKLEDMGKLNCIITQNIDSLHHKANNSHVIEMHGHTREYVCSSSVHHRLLYEDVDQKIISSGQAVVCSECQSYMKPDIIFFGEHVKDLEKALTEVQKADLLLVIGTSLTVYPAASLPEYCGDNTKIVIINAMDTPFDKIADLVFRDDIDQLAMKMGLAPR